MNDFLALAAKASPNRSALISSGGTITYANLNIQVADICAQLDALGLKRGNRVAVLLDRSIESIQLVHAVARLGVIIVPLNTRLTRAEMENWVELQQYRRWRCEKGSTTRQCEKVAA